MWQLSSRAAVDYFCLIKWHSPSVILSRSKNTLLFDTTLSFFTHLIVSCGMKKQKHVWHLPNVPFWLRFIWFYYYSFCHCLNFIPWLCFVDVAIRSFCFLCVFVWCDFSSSLTSRSLFCLNRSGIKFQNNYPWGWIHIHTWALEKVRWTGQNQLYSHQAKK